jgi:hypothetical protein
LEKKKMGRLACQNYGFACNFMTKKDVIEKVIQEFNLENILYKNTILIILKES